MPSRATPIPIASTTTTTTTMNNSYTPSRRGSMAYPFAASSPDNGGAQSNGSMTMAAGSPPTRTRTMSLYDVYAQQGDGKVGSEVAGGL